MIGSSRSSTKSPRPGSIRREAIFEHTRDDAHHAGRACFIVDAKVLLEAETVRVHIEAPWHEFLFRLNKHRVDETLSAYRCYAAAQALIARSEYEVFETMPRFLYIEYISSRSLTHRGSSRVALHARRGLARVSAPEQSRFYRPGSRQNCRSTVA